MRRVVPLERYDGIAIALHWAMAIGIVTLIVLGLVMTHVTSSPANLYSLYQLHKSIGVTILLAAVLRLGWRLTHRPPELPASMPAAERTVATGTHWLLYLILFALPLSGWALVSASPLGIHTVLYGVVPWPDLPGFTDLTDKVAAAKTIGSIHAWGAYGLIVLIVLHAAAALRHHFALHDDVLTRMLPAGRRRRTDKSKDAQQ